MAEYHNVTPRGWVPNHPAGSGNSTNNGTTNANKVLDDDFVAAVWDIFDSAGNVLLSKHKDYGPTNISLSPGGPLNGLRVRMHDKTARINHLIDSGATPENESLRDSFLDLMNYSAIALMVLDGKWPRD